MNQTKADELERRAETEFGTGDGVLFNGIQYVPMKLLRDAISALREAQAEIERLNVCAYRLSA